MQSGKAKMRISLAWMSLVKDLESVKMTNVAVVAVVAKVTLVAEASDHHCNTSLMHIHFKEIIPWDRRIHMTILFLPFVSIHYIDN